MILNSNNKGITLVEVSMVVAIFIAISVVGLQLYSKLKAKESLNSVVGLVMDATKRAQKKSQTVEGDSQWGFRINQSNVIVFKGNDFANRVTSFDETYTFPATVSLAGDVEYIFSKMNGWPDAAGSFSITYSGVVKSLSINAQGTFIQ